MIKVTATDFDNLTTNSMEWGLDWTEKADRFEPTGNESFLLFNWQYAHWTDTYMGAMLCRSYLDYIGIKCAIFFDITTAEYVLLTNYAGSFASVS